VYGVIRAMPAGVPGHANVYAGGRIEVVAGGHQVE
jgi:hypothetical protein